MRKIGPHILLFLLLATLASKGYSIALDSLQQLDTVWIVADKQSNSLLLDKLYSVRSNDATIGILQQDAGKMLQFLFPIQINSYGLGNISTISVRGTNDDHNSVYWNGLKVNSMTLGSTDISLIPAMLDGNDVINLQKNTHAIGGALNWQNIPDWRNNVKFKWRSDFNSFASFQNSFQLRVGNQRVQWHSAAYYQTAKNNFPYVDVYRFNNPIDTMEHNQLKAGGALNSLFFKMKKQQTFSIHNWYNEKHKEVPSIMGTNEISGRNQKDKSIKTVAKYTKIFSDNELQISVAHTYDYLKYTDKRLPTDTFLFINSSYKTHRLVHTLSYSDSLKHQLHIQTGYTYEMDLANVKEYTKTITEHIGEVYGQLSWHLNDFNAAFKLSQPFTSYRYIRPQFVIDWQYTPKQKWYTLALHYADKYHFPDMNDRYWSPGGNPDLIPETAWSLALENKINVLKHRDKFLHNLNCNVDVYYTKIKNNIVWSPINSVLWSPKNIKVTQTYGSDLVLNYTLSEQRRFQFNLKTIYSFNKSTIVEDVNNEELKGKYLRYKPMHTFKSNFYIEQQYFGLGLNYMFQSLRFTDEENFDFFALKPYHILDAFITFKGNIKQQHDVQIIFKINNITNVAYQSIRSYAQPLRNYSISLIYNFSKSQNSVQ